MNIYPESYARYQEMVIPGALLLIHGSINRRNEEAVLTVEAAQPLEPALAREITGLTWIVRENIEAIENFASTLRSTVEPAQGNLTIQIGFAMTENYYLEAEIASSLGWRWNREGFDKMRRDPAVLGFVLNLKPLQKSEPAWKKRSRSRPA